MGFLHQSLRVRARNARQGDGEVDIQAKAAGRARSDPHCRGHRRVRRHFRAALRSDELHRANEAGGIAGGEQLLWIVACTAAATELLRSGEFDVQRAVERRGMAIAAPGGLGAGFVKHVHGHDDLPVCGFDTICIAHN